MPAVLEKQQSLVSGLKVDLDELVDKLGKGYPVFHNKKMTPQEFIYYSELDPDYQYEYVNNICEVKPVTTPKHQRISLWLTDLIHSYLKLNRIAEVYTEGVNVEFSGNFRKPDIMLLVDSPNPSREDYYGIPALIIEILSPSNKKNDLIDKKLEYLSKEVGEYWIIDPDKLDTHFYLYEDGHYIDALLIDGIYKSRFLSGLQLRLEDLYNLKDPYLLANDDFYEKTFGALKKEGMKDEKIRVTKNMLLKNLDFSLISDITGLSIIEIENIKNEL